MLTQSRKEAAKRRRRLIVNNDGNDCRRPPRSGQVTAEDFLENRTSPLVGSHVDAIFYCTGVFNYYTHHSEETELRTGGDKGVVDWAHELIETGRDSLQIMVEFCHEQGWECFWSFRANDTHDSSDSRLLCQWKQDHPGCLMGQRGDVFPFGSNRWSSVNYGLTEVHDKVYRILTDVCTRYDVDGIELDFFRHPVLFKASMMGETPTRAECEMMTDLFARIREMTETESVRRGRPLLIGIRIPDSVEYCRELGLDVEALLEQGLVDIVVGGGYFKLGPWENLVALGRRYDVPAYACFVSRRILGGGKPNAKSDLPRWRGETLRAWQAGVDGVYTFNRFNPDDPQLREIGDPGLLMTLDCVDQEAFVAEDCWSKPESWVKDGRRFLLP